MLQAKTASEYNQTSGASPVLVSELPVFGSDTRDIYNPRLININNGYILGDFGIPATQDGCIIKDSLMWEDLNEDAPKLSAIWAERDHCTFLGGEYIPLYGRWSENFYHWVWENVPAIIMAETAGYRGNYIACSNKYIPQIFEMLGVSINRVFGYRGGSFRVEKLYAPVRPTANSLTAVPGLFLETRNRMLNAAGGPKDSVHRKLYISRSKSNRPRQVINESDVLDVVTRYGFEPVCLEDHSVREQVALMSTAVAIIGPHGAGVTQCMFARPRSLIVEFFAPTYINTAIMAALKILNHKYYPLTSQNWTVQYPHGDHILVYADLLDHILRQEYVR